MRQGLMKGVLLLVAGLTLGVYLGYGTARATASEEAPPGRGTADIGGLRVRADCPLARNEHPRLLLSKADLDRVREQVKGPKAADFRRLREDVEQRLQQKDWRGVPALAVAVLYRVTEDGKYAEIFKSSPLVQNRKDPLALDLLWDTLSPDEIKSLADDTAGQIAKREWQWFVSHYRMAMLLYGTGHHDKEFGEAIAKAHGFLKDRLMVDLNGWAADRGGDVNSFGYIGNHSVYTFWPALQCYSTALGEDLWPQSTWSEFLAAYHVYHLRPDRHQVVHVDMENMCGPHGGLDAFGFMDLFWWRVPGVFNEGLTRWWVEQEFGGSIYGLIGKMLWCKEDVPALAPDRYPPARLFPTPGYAVMRSDWSEGAVYASLRSGAWSNFTDGRHPAWNNTFIIYRKGPLAVNTGAHHGKVAGPLKFDHPNDPPLHSKEYATLTIASNGILVRNPEDADWPKSGRPNDGGQLFGALSGWDKIRPIPKAPSAMGDPGFYGGRIVAYETSPAYDYACGDATNSYSPKRVESFTRQFVYLRPELFVIFDRVTATDPRFTKTWVMHTPAKPLPNDEKAEQLDKRIHPEGHFLWTCDGGLMTNRQGGRLFWKVLLPENREVRLLGGEGHDFEVEGANRGPTSETYKMPDTYPLAELANLRGWRIEVDSKNERADEVFLNVLQATDSATPQTVRVDKVDVKGGGGVRIAGAGKTYEVSFTTAGKPGGHVRIVEGGKAVVDRDLVQEVRDNYADWRDDPRYKEWMTNPYMRTVIGEAEQDAYGGREQPREREP